MDLVEQKSILEHDIKKYEAELYGFEYEEDEANIEIEIERPFDADKVRIDQRMLSLKYIIELLDSENKKLVLSPGFQRNIVWTDIKRKSLLIESLMLRIPIPAFYFYEDEDSTKYVIDGLQRLTTIYEYLKDGFKLSGLQYLQNSCGNKYFSELQADQQLKKYATRIFETQLAVNIIDARTPSQVKFVIFRRINTGGIPLNMQEIRNAIARPRTRNFLRKLAGSKEFLNATRNRVNDLRMGAQELVLRFFAFYLAYDYNLHTINYKSGDLEEFLDNTFEHINNCPDAKLNEYEKIFVSSMNNAKALFGNYAFSKPSSNWVINKALFSSFSAILANYNNSENIFKAKREKAVKIFVDRITNDWEYVNSITSGTSATRKIEYNFKVARSIIDEVLNND